MTDDELREMLALAAIGALDDAEQAEIEDAVADRPDLQAELTSLRNAATALADAVSERPPASLRANLLDLIADTPQDAPVDVAAPEPAIAPVVPISSARRRRWSAVLAAAAAVVILAVGVVVVRSVSDSGSGDQVAAVVDSDDAIATPLQGELSGLQLVHSPTLDKTVLVGDDLPAPDADNVYELWLIQDAAPVPVDTFRPNDDGSVGLVLDTVPPAEGTVYAVTVEPAGGSETPTLPIVAATA